MDVSEQLEILKRKRALLLAKLDEMAMDGAEKYEPSEASAQILLKELAPIHDQIAALDREILRISPLSSLETRANLLQATLAGRTHADIRKDRSLGNAMFDRAAVNSEILRRSRNRKNLLRFIALGVLVLLFALSKFASTD